MKNLGLFLTGLTLLILQSCSKPPQQSLYETRISSTIPDYSNLQFWAAHPDKKDPSDSVPEPIRADYQQDTTADVFFVHPTSYTAKGREDGWNAAINDATLNQKTDQGSILYQASIFNASGRIFAPRYRQAHISAYFPTTPEEGAEALLAFDLAYQDVKAAFEYYLAHYNHGRPIIIASHSQGSTHTKRLLKEFFDGKPLQKQLVVAYVIGMAVENNLLKNIPACDKPNQTGCVCSWRTYKNDFVPDFVQKEKFKAIVTNPLTWDAGKPHADRSDNKGGFLLKFNQLAPQVTDATISGNILWSGKPVFPGSLFYLTKNYHVGDLNLYYLNVRDNVADRIAAYRKNKPRS